MEVRVPQPWHFGLDNSLLGGAVTVTVPYAVGKLCTTKRNGQALTLGTCEGDPIWESGLCRGNQGKLSHPGLG